jgi:acetamidase/formamidase
VSLEHVADPMRVHHEWDAALAPALSIGSGDVVHFDLAMAGAGQVSRGGTYADTAFDWSTLYNLIGPIVVDGAEVGDTLEVEILALTPGEWGWTAILPDLGLLADDFPDPYVRTFELGDRPRIEFASDISVPVVPFLGTMGTHPGDPLTASPFPPHRGGGNIDNRHLTVGASLLLPVWQRGAMFSCGDPHAAQGDGEVCVSAVECDMRATLRFSIHKRTLAAPMYKTVHSSAGERDARAIATMGIDADLMVGARIAVRAMIDWLVSEHALSRQDAYMLASLAGDLRIHEIVDAGVWNVGFALPASIFAGGV